MQVSVKTLSGGKTVTVDVTSSDAIDKVEVKIQDKAGDDGCSSADSDIQKKPAFRLKGGMQIFVNTPAGKEIPLKVERLDTVHSVKAKIQCSEDLPTYDWKLVFGSDQLEDGHTLADCNIQRDSILHVVRPVKGGMLIFVETAIGTTIPLLVECSDTIKCLKFQIQVKEDIPFDEQKLVFDGNWLSDCCTVEEYNIEEKSTLQLVRRLRGGMLIFVKTLTGRMFPFVVKCSDTVHSIKAKMHDMLGVQLHNQRLFFGSKLLEDSHTLAEYNIVEESTLYWSFLIRG